MKILASVIALSVLTTVAVSLHAATQPVDEKNRVITQATPHDRLLSVDFEGDEAIAVGESGLLQTSTDGGKTWKREPAPTTLAMIDVATNGTRTIAVGQVGLILVKDRDGAWRKVDSGTDRRLLQVDINKNGLAFVTGAFGTLLKSTDAGETWKSVAPNWAGLYDSGQGDTAVLRDEPTNYVVHVADDGSALIGGEYGQLMRSPDGGVCWEIAYRHPQGEGEVSPTIFGMSIRGDGVGYAVGQSGFVARTADGGLSWTALKTPVTGSLFGVASFADGQVVAVGQRVALRSHDEGATWNPIKALDLNLNWYSAMGYGTSARAGEVVAVGHSGRIISLIP